MKNKVDARPRNSKRAEVIDLGRVRLATRVKSLRARLISIAERDGVETVIDILLECGGPPIRVRG